MRPLVLAALITGALAGSLRAADSAALPAHAHLSLDDGWRFALGETAGAQDSAFDDARWRSLNVPHDWSIELPMDQKAPVGGSGGYFPGGIGWYRRHFLTSPAWQQKTVTLRFDGVYMKLPGLPQWKTPGQTPVRLLER
jgi:beta-galactosidase